MYSIPDSSTERARANFEEANQVGTTITITGGPLTGTMTNVRNALTYFSYPTCMGWEVGKFSVVDGADSITGVMVSDVENVGSEQYGYLFALSAGTTTGEYAGKEYFGFTSSATTPGTYDFTGSADLYELEEMRAQRPSRYPVGGVLTTSNKLVILAPYLTLIGLIVAVTAAAVVVKRRGKER